MRFNKYLAIICAFVCLACAVQAVEPEPLPFVEGSWTLVLLPDTQIYAQKYGGIFKSQTQWIAANAEKRNIVFVMGEGDVTNLNTPEQWASARAAFRVLDGKVPYALGLGNHDYLGKSSVEERKTLANEYFPPKLIQASPAYGGAYEQDKLDNTYYLFSAGGRDWIALSLEFAPRDGVVDWANKVLDTYPKRCAIICTHAYLHADRTRFDHTTGVEQAYTPHKYIKTGVNDGEELWQKLVSKHANVEFVFCGHVTQKSAARLKSKGIYGNVVYQILANYQAWPNGGNGYLRLVEFLPDGKKVQVKTYSPFLNKYITDNAQQFTLDLPPAP